MPVHSKAVDPSPSSNAQSPSSPEQSTPKPSIAHLDRVTYLFGHPISHSLAPLLHQTIYDALGLKWSYFLIDSTNIPHFLSLIHEPKFIGAAVTMPHKIAIIPHLDALTPEGEAVGAINTIFLREEDGKRRFWGTNTDCIGIREAILREAGAEKAAAMRGRPGMVIGGGGTSRAAVYALKKWIGCGDIYMVNRDKSEVDVVIAQCTASGFGDGLVHVASEEQAEALPVPAVIVSAVPDFPPRTPSEIMVRKVLKILLSKEKGVMLEMCYHPNPVTEISELARRMGWTVVGGAEAMIWQGLEQEKYWTGREMTGDIVEKVERAVRAALIKSNL